MKNNILKRKIIGYPLMIFMFALMLLAVALQTFADIFHSISELVNKRIIQVLDKYYPLADEE